MPWSCICESIMWVITLDHTMKYVKKKHVTLFACEVCVLFLQGHAERFIYMWCSLFICKILLSLEITQRRSITHGVRADSFQFKRAEVCVWWRRKLAGEREVRQTRQRDDKLWESHKEGVRSHKADLKQETSTSARLSHQRCMAAWQILRMSHWHRLHSSRLVEALYAWPRSREDVRRI